jgi:16S rRNA processing protein RimM
MTTSQKEDHDSSTSVTRGSDVQQSEPRFLAVGQITKAHGLHGEVSVVVMTDFVERFDTMETIYVGDETSATLYIVESTRWNKDRVLVRFADISDRTAAQALRGLYLQIPLEEAMPLEADVYYQYQLIGLSVITDDGNRLGSVTDVLETGANDVYVVSGPQGDILLPATKEVILSIDLEAQQIVVHLLEGLS